MQPAQKQFLEFLVAEARAEMQRGAVRDHALACVLGSKIMEAAVWESMDEAEMNCFAEAVLDVADWLQPSSRELSDFMISDMTLRCVLSKSTRK